MKECTQCGKCCLHYSDGGLSASAEEVEAWEIFNPAIAKYVVDGMMKGWAVRWRSKGWMRTKTEKAKNADLWAELLSLCERHDVEFRWVKGHAGVTENERCDFLVNREQAKQGLPADEVYEKEVAGQR